MSGETRRPGKATGVTDDARRSLTEDERARAQAARHYGEACGLCGRPFMPDETIWLERLAIRSHYGGRGTIYWRTPVCGVCASPAFRVEAEVAAPERCAGCGRGVRYRAGAHGRRVALCSRACNGRHQSERARKASGA